MQKFTIFTILLTGLVVVVVSEIVVNEYLPQVDGNNLAQEDLQLDLPDSLDLSQTIGTSVLGSGNGGLKNYLGADVAPTEIDLPELEAISRVVKEVKDPEVISNPSLFDNNPLFGSDEVIEGATKIETSDPSPSGLDDFENTDVDVVRYSPNVYIREEQLRSAGFVAAYLEEEANSGSFYKTIPIDDLKDVTMNLNLIRTDSEMLAKVYVMKAGINININDVYAILRTRAASGLNVELNETNDFGVNSFYMNDNSRPNTVFLTVRLGNLIYGFSYPKTYHSQIKNLIQLIEWELS